MAEIKFGKEGHIFERVHDVFHIAAAIASVVLAIICIFAGYKYMPPIFILASVSALMETYMRYVKFTMSNKKITYPLVGLLASAFWIVCSVLSIKCFW